MYFKVCLWETPLSPIISNIAPNKVFDDVIEELTTKYICCYDPNEHTCNYGGSGTQAHPNHDHLIRNNERCTGSQQTYSYFDI